MPVAQQAAWVSNSFCRYFMWKGLVWCFSDNPDCFQNWPESAVVACWHSSLECAGDATMHCAKSSASMIYRFQLSEASGNLCAMPCSSISLQILTRHHCRQHSNCRS